MTHPHKPKTDVVQNDPMDSYAAERQKNLHNTPPGGETTVGTDTVGQGQPSLQPVKQEESSRPTAVPTDKSFANPGDFYSPSDTERAEAQKNADKNGAAKTGE